jgi:WD40 repeat protein/serine/threonine protein kinase
MAETSDGRDVLLNQLADEFSARRRDGERPSLEEYCARHPDLADDIRSLFPAMVELERAKADADPEMAVAVTEAPPVTRLGDFRLLREVGRGGMGVVYEAEQVSLGRRVAIKLLPATLFRDPGKRRRFEREAKAAARLHHTNIVPVHGYGEHDGTPYYVMQFIPGLGLDAVIDELSKLPGASRPSETRRRKREDAELSVALARSLVGAAEAGIGGWKSRFDDNPTLTSAGRVTPGGTEADSVSLVRSDRGSSVSVSSSGVHLPGQSGSGVGGSVGKKTTYWESVARIGVQVAGALTYAHKLGVLHRDIKPANLLLDLDGIVWVTDFGLAKADNSDNLTHTGDLLGTLRYMPPEAFEGKSDARSDVYGLGLTLFEMVALRPAYEEHDRNKLIKQVTTGEPPRLRRLRKDAPRDLVTIVEKAIDRHPARRYQSAGAMTEDLQRFLDGRPITARRATELERAWMWARRRPAMAGLIAALILVLLAGSVVSSVFAIRAAEFARDAAAREKDATLARDVARRNAADAETARDASRRREEDAVAARKEAETQRELARQQREVTQENLYYAQLHLARQAWREHRGLPYLRELLAKWLPKDNSRDRRGWEWFYVNSLGYQNLRTLTEGGVHKGSCSVAWHVASKRLAEGTADGLIRIWDVDREQTTLILRGPAPAITYFGMRWLAWSPDGGRLAAGCKDGTVHIWETATGREIHVLREHKTPVQSVAFSSDGKRVAAWGQYGTIKIWNASTGQLTEEVVHPGAVVTAGAWSPDDKTFATGHFNGTVTLSPAHAGAETTKLRAHVDWIYHLAWSPDSSRLATTSANDFFVSIWNVATQKTVLGPLRHSHGITTIEWEPGGQRLATGSMDETVKIWDANTGHEEVTLRGQQWGLTSLAWGPDGRLASGGSDGSMRVWNSIRDQESNVLPGHVGRATSVAWSPDGKRLASAGDDGKVRIWDPVTRKEVRTLDAHDRGRIIPQFGLIRSLAWNPDGTYLASAGLDGKAKVWEVATGREIFSLPADRGPVWCVAWNGDGTCLAAGSRDGTIRIVEGLPGTATVRHFQAHERRDRDLIGREGVRALAWSPQGDRLASGGYDGLLKVWDPIRGAELARMEAHTGWVLGVCWNPDGTQLASAGSDRLVIAWDAKTGQNLKTMRGHNDFVEAVVWNPDGTRLASASIDNSVRIWDPRVAAEAFVLRGRPAMFHDVSWHPDGAQLAAASSDGQIWIWDATPGFEHDSTARAYPVVDRKIAGKPANNAEHLRFAQLAYNHKRFVAATQLWSEALASDPKLTDDPLMRYRYYAARAACMAAAGQGRDEPPLDDAAKAKLRRQALDWMSADLTGWGRLLESGAPQHQPTVVQILSQWQQDANLASVREAEALAKLPAGESKAFTQLWTDVAELLKKAETATAAK